MKIIGKTGQGFIVEMSSDETAKAAGLHSSYSDEWRRLGVDVGTEVRFIAALGFHSEIRRRQDEAKKAASTLRVLADLMDSNMPEIVLQPTEGNTNGE